MIVKIPVMTNIEQNWGKNEVPGRKSGKVPAKLCNE
jgi:hypothetical protein